MVDTIVYSQAEFSFSVVPSPIIAIIKGGLQRDVRREDVIILDGSMSYDPDYSASILR